MSEIPEGLCQCGCGMPAPLSKQTRRGYVRGGPQKYVLGHSPRLRGQGHGRWIGGRRVDSSGYVEIRQPGHHRGPNGYVKEHVLVVEAVLGRRISGEHPIHHFDEDRTNNSPGNLVVCEDQAYHELLHRRMDALEGCGNPDALRCSICGEWDAEENLAVTQLRGKRARLVAYHRPCAAKKARERKARLRRQA